MHLDASHAGHNFFVPNVDAFVVLCGDLLHIIIIIIIIRRKTITKRK